MTFSVCRAEPADNQAILALLDRNPIPGSIEVVMQCRPSFFQAQQVKGDYVQVGIGRERATGAVVGVGVRSIATLYVDSRPVRVGYLSGLRIDRRFRGSSLLARAFRFLKELDQDQGQDQQCAFYLTTIIDDNAQAKKLLTSKRAGLPAYIDWGRFCTACLYPGRTVQEVRHGRRVTVCRGNRENRKELVAFLNQQGAEKQFFPKIDLDDCSSRLQASCLEDWYLLYENDRLAAAALKWDQSGFRQTIITGYHGMMRIASYLSRLQAVFSVPPFLPAAGNALRQLYVSFCTVRNNDPELASILIGRIYNDTCRQGRGYVLIGFHETDPLLSCMDRFRHKKYWSRLYLVSWHGTPAIEAATVRTPFLEAACL